MCLYPVGRNQKLGIGILPKTERSMESEYGETSTAHHLLQNRFLAFSIFVRRKGIALRHPLNHKKVLSLNSW
jgi:hypothetical protein